MLCGGASARMGRDKAFVAYDGIAMVQRVSATLGAAGCDVVVAVGGDAPALTAAGLACVPDEFPGEGPLGGVITALHHLRGHRAVMVVACDLPLLTPATVAAVLGALIAASPDIGAVMAFTDHLEPMCAAWRPGAAVELLAAFRDGERRLRVASRRLGVVELSVPSTDLANVNTPADLPQ
ncbi:MAG: molybdenum cofactor guanylyltransferase [Actinomycetota bacterium]